MEIFSTFFALFLVFSCFLPDHSKIEMHNYVCVLFAFILFKYEYQLSALSHAQRPQIDGRESKVERSRKTNKNLDERRELTVK